LPDMALKWEDMSTLISGQEGLEFIIPLVFVYLFIMMY